MQDKTPPKNPLMGDNPKIAPIATLPNQFATPISDFKKSAPAPIPSPVLESKKLTARSLYPEAKEQYLDSSMPIQLSESKPVSSTPTQYKRFARITTAAVVSVLLLGILVITWNTKSAQKSLLAIKNGSNTATIPNQNNPIQISLNNATLKLNRNTIIGGGKKLSATGTVAIQNEADSIRAFSIQNAKGGNLMVADTVNNRIGIGKEPTGTAALQVAGDVSANGNILSGGGKIVLGPDGLRINNVLICSANGCVSSSSPTQTSPAIDVANVAYINVGQVFSGNNSFNGTTTLSNATGTFNGNGSGLSGVNAITLQGNDTTYFTNATNITSGTINDARLSSNVALLSANNVFLGNSTFSGTTIQNGNFLFQSAGNSIGAFQIQNAAGNNNLLIADTINSRIGIGVQPNYTLDVKGDVNVSAGNTFRINGVDVCSGGLCNPSSGSSFYIQNGTTLQTGANFNMQSANSNNVGGIIRGANGQTADLLELQNFGGASVFAVNPSGDVNITGQYKINGATICTLSGCTAASGSNSYIQNGTALQTAANFNIESATTGTITGILRGKSGQTADILQTKDGNGATTVSIGNNGQTLFKNSSNSNVGFQIQASDSTVLLTANTMTGQILLPNASISSTALLLGGDANLYRSFSSTLKTDGNLVVAGNTTLTGTVLAKNTSDSAIAFQVQNSASQNLINVDTSSSIVTIGNGNGTTAVSVQCGTGNCVFGTNATAHITNVGSINTTSTTTVQSGTGGLILDGSAATIIAKIGTAQTSALKIINSQSTALINIDTSADIALTVLGFESSMGNFVGLGGGSASLSTAQQYAGLSSLAVTTTAAAGDGTKYSSPGIAPSTTYTLTMFIRTASGTFNTMEIGHTEDNGVTQLPCLSAQTVANNGWTRYSCTFLTGTPTGVNYIYIKQTDATARTFYIDSYKLQSGSIATTVKASGISLMGYLLQPANFQNQSDSTTAFEIQNSVGTNKLFTVDTLNTKIGIGGAPTATGALLQVNGNLSAAGQVSFQNSVNSTSAFQVQNSAGNNFIQLDSTNATLYLGNPGIASTVQIGNTTGAVAQAVNIGNNSTTNSSTSILLGSLVGSSTTVLQGGTGTNALALLTNGGGSIKVGAVGTVTTGNVSDAGGSGIISFNVPAAVQNGDYMIAILKTVGATSVGAPAGWTALESDQNVSAAVANIYYRVANNEPASYNWGSADANGRRIIVMAYRNVSGIDAHSPSSTSTTNTVVGNSITTTQANEIIIFAGVIANPNTWTTPGGFTSEKISTGPVNGTLAYFDKSQTQAGATGAVVSTVGGSAATTAGFMLSLVPTANGNSSLSVSSSSVFKNSTNSTTAFQIQNAAGISLLTADTTNNTITLGTPSSTPVILVLGIKNTSGDPSCTDGGIYYNSNSAQIRGCVNGAYNTIGGVNTASSLPTTNLYDGRTVKLRMSSSPYEFVTLTYDATYAKWVSERELVTTSINDKTDGSTGITTASTSYIDAETVTGGDMLNVTAIPWRTYNTAGLIPQFRMTCMTSNGASGANAHAQMAYRPTDLAQTGAVPSQIVITSSVVNGNSGQPILDTGWVQIPAGFTVKDTIQAGVQIKADAGTTNISRVGIWVRWVSP